MRVAFPLQVLLGVVLLAPGLTGAAAAVATECDFLAVHPSGPDAESADHHQRLLIGWTREVVAGGD